MCRDAPFIPERGVDARNVKCETGKPRDAGRRNGNGDPPPNPLPRGGLARGITGDFDLHWQRTLHVHPTNHNGDVVVSRHYRDSLTELWYAYPCYSIFTPRTLMPLRYSRYLTIALLFIAFFWLYAAMSAPELDWGDAGESQLAAWTAGLSHPTGYPLFLILGWLWTHTLALIGVEPTRAMTLFSVVCGAASVACIVPATTALLKRTVPNSEKAGILPGLLTAIAFGLSPTFWSQALLAEVYTLHVLLLVLFLWVLWEEKPRWGLAAFLYGLFLSHHRTAILWVPGLLLWLWLEARELFRPVPFLRLLGLVLLPQLAYLYIPLRGVVTPYLQQPMGNGETLSLYDGSFRAFVEHILGTVFAADVGLRESLAARLGRVWGLLILNVSFFGLVPLVALVWSGRHGSGRTPRNGMPSADVWLLGSGVVFTILFGLFYAIGDVEVMFLPAWLALLWLAAIGVMRWFAAMPRVGAFVGFWVVVLVLVARVPYAPDSRADHTAPRTLVNDLFAATPPADAILITNDRNELVPVWYAQFAEGQRRDMTMLAPLITPRPEHATTTALTGWALQFDRPVYLTKEMPGLALRYDLEPAAPPLVRVVGFATLPTTPPLESNLAPNLTVTGWQPPTTLAAGETVSVPVALTPQSPLADSISLSLQLHDAGGNRLTQQDIAPDVFYPPTAWAAGESVRYTFDITLPDPLPEGVVWRLSGYVLNEDGTFTSVGRQVVLGEQ